VTTRLDSGVFTLQRGRQSRVASVNRLTLVVELSGSNAIALNAFAYGTPIALSFAMTLYLQEIEL
jgi:hypothetical protein